MRNLMQRVVTSVILLPLVFIAFILGGPYLIALLGVVSLAACLEASHIVMPRNKLSMTMVLIFWAGLFWPVIFASHDAFLLFVIPAIFLINLIVLFSSSMDAAKFEKLSAIFYWSMYTVVAIGCVYWLVTAPFLGPKIGLSFVWLACISTWSNDTFAYFGGRLFGKRPLFERVSQKKTWEGFFAGALGTVIFVALLNLILSWCGFEIFQGLSGGDLLWVTVPSVVISPLGDLIESKFKRLYNAKDSSNILPGHGGILDRIDGLLMMMPWTCLYAFIIRPLW